MTCDDRVVFAACCQVIFSKFEDLLPKHLKDGEPDMSKPTEEAIEEVSISFFLFCLMATVDSVAHFLFALGNQA